MFENYIKNVKKEMVKSVSELGNVIKKSVEEKSPIDSGEYIQGNKDTGVKQNGNEIWIKIYNNSPNSKEVEYGFRRSPVNWHKYRRLGGSPIYRGVGARVYTRSLDENIYKIRNNLLNAVLVGSKQSKIS